MQVGDNRAGRMSGRKFADARRLIKNMNAWEGYANRSAGTDSAAMMPIMVAPQLNCRGALPETGI